MKKLSILMSRGDAAAWQEAHPLGSQVAVSVAGVQLDGQVAEFADYHGDTEVRVRLNLNKKEKL